MEFREELVYWIDKYLSNLWFLNIIKGRFKLDILFQLFLDIVANVFYTNIVSNRFYKW